MSDITYTEISKNGLWTNNVALVQLLGLCPLLAVTNSTINGLGMGMATLLTLTLTGLSISLIRNWVRPEIRVPVFVIIIAAIVTAIELAMNAWLHDLYKVLGIFIALIVTNCSVLARAEAFASRNKPLPAMLDGLMMGLGFAAVLVTLGALREIIGMGTLLAGAERMFGETAKNWTLVLIPDYRGFLLAVLPPGAFISLGLMVALKNVIDRRAKKQTVPISAPSATAPGVALGSGFLLRSTASILGGVPPVTHMDVGNAKAMLEHRWPSMQSSPLKGEGATVSLRDAHV